jgi:cholest-4-en-3-one 26-monooxygenase
MGIFDEIDLTDLDVFAERMPHEWFDALRREHPVWLHPATDEEAEPFWVVSSYEHIIEVHRSGTLYSHQTGPGREGAGGIALTDIEAGRGPGLQMVMTDPPQHTRYRKLVNTGFTPRMIRRLDSVMRTRTDLILDQICEAGEADFVTQVSAELPLMAIADILGVPDGDRKLLFDWSNRTIGGSDPEFSSDPSEPGGEYEKAVIEMAMYAHELTERKRAEPADDVWTALTEARVTLDDGTVAELTDLERDLFFTLLIVAGNETTRNSISLGMLAFFDHPDQWQRVRDHGMDSTAVDEVLRHTSPVNYFRRTATADTQLGGESIRAGDKVTLWYPSGNRDEKVYDDPHRLDLTRTPNHHLAFGGGGAHFCLGANLARLEIEIMFEGLARRLPDLEATGPADRLRMNLVNGVKHLPVAFTPSAPVLTTA